MGSAEYIIVLCFVITIWSNSVVADIDCRRFVFAPSCRGVSAKRASLKTHDNHGKTTEELTDDRQEIPLEADFELDVPSKAIGFQKRLLELLRRPKVHAINSKRYNLLKHLEDVLRSRESDYD